ncbi:hypothetical protein CCHR01_12305 [Colletotrichum chrysophilum]|uniref:Uncharacterized protein n=1 Tax=Colletotrichum chrysophilum TaxID=1836956 RepID=A0AAD9EHM2_9PEZI|nr:hypothetical protein CCHR01_12305 [Colletotrichum chrysophilum]
MEKDGYAAAAAGRKVAEKLGLGLGLGLDEGVEDDGLDCTWQLGERFTSTDEARAKRDARTDMAVVVVVAVVGSLSREKEMQRGDSRTPSSLGLSLGLSSVRLGTSL